jgi:AcrR family transcriptional regulator
MYLRVATRKNKNGTSVRYLQLAHNQWDAAAGVSRPKVLHNFGREDQLDRAAVQRLIASLTRALDPAEALSATTAGRDELVFCGSRPLGGTWALDGLWRRLGIEKIMSGLLAGRRIDARTERVLFALVANRALAASSKLAAAGWVSRDCHIDGLAEVDEDSCYRAMDWLLEIEESLAEQVYWQVADLLNLEVDLLFFDTTSTYFETEGADALIARDDRGQPTGDSATGDRPITDSAVGDDPDAAGSCAGFRAFGHSKDHRGDLPQVVVGMAVTRTGIPVRCWCWPGNTTDSALIRQVRDDLRAWTLARVVWVGDRGFSSAANRRYLQRGGGHYILGEKLRSGSPEATAALSRPGRYQQVAGNLRVKEVRVADDERFVVCHNPEAADRDAAVRERLLAQLGEAIAGSDTLSPTKRAELRGQLRTKPGLNRFLRTTSGGLLRIDRAAVKTEANLDGKFLLRSSDPALSAEDIALGYKQLLEVERGWRDMKQILDLRPVYHRREDRIRAHVLLCWLALLLIRIAETTTDQTWNQLRTELQRLHLGTFTGPAGTFRQATEPTTAQRDILTALELPTPPRIVELSTAPSPAA